MNNIVFVVSEHNDKGSTIVQEIHKDKEYAYHRAKVLASSNNLCYNVIEHILHGYPD